LSGEKVTIFIFDSSPVVPFSRLLRDLELPRGIGGSAVSNLMSFQENDIIVARNRLKSVIIQNYS